MAVAAAIALAVLVAVVVLLPVVTLLTAVPAWMLAYICAITTGARFGI